MFDRRQFLGLGSATFAQAAFSGSALATGGTLPYPGVNLAGGEFGKGDRLNWDYVYPSEKQVAYYASRGFKLLRIPVKSSRLIANGKPNSADVDILKSIVSEAAARHMTVVIDLHEYALKPDGQPLTAESADLASFHQTWKVMAASFREKSNVWFGLMNEPNKQLPDVWFKLANAGIAGIRESTPQHVITVMGSRWGTADGWIKSGNAKASAALRDPSNKLILEMHQYVDNAGGKPERAGPVAGMGATALEQATTWARANKQKLFLGEFGVTSDPVYLEEGRAMLRHMYANADVWVGYAYWAGGLWWAEGRSTYGFSLEPASLDTPKDRAQLLMLREFM
jgi:endoglucanase